MLMRGRMSFPVPFLPSIIVVSVFGYLSSLVPACFRKLDNDEPSLSSEATMPTAPDGKQYDPFANPPMDDPEDSRETVEITTKFVEISSGTEELEFDWIVAPFSSGQKQAGLDIPSLLDAIECDRRNLTESMQRVVDTETKDQLNYTPASFKMVPIVMRNPGKGYHGPTKGSYIFIVENYSSEEAAAKRASDYINPGYRERIAEPDSLEQEGKSSVRCWGIAKGKSAYLLTTHAFSFKALEKLTHDLERKLTTHLAK